MSSARGLGAVILVTLMLVHAGSALKCFHCDSSSDARCDDYFHKSHYALKDCALDRRDNDDMDWYCKKVIHSVNPDGSGRTVLRACASAHRGDAGKICQESVAAGATLKHCSICSTDQCNAAPGSTLPPSLALCLLPAAAAAAVAVVLKAA